MFSIEGERECFEHRGGCSVLRENESVLNTGGVFSIEGERECFEHRGWVF